MFALMSRPLKHCSGELSQCSDSDVITTTLANPTFAVPPTRSARAFLRDSSDSDSGGSHSSLAVSRPGDNIVGSPGLSSSSGRQRSVFLAPAGDRWSISLAATELPEHSSNMNAQQMLMTDIVTHHDPGINSEEVCPVAVNSSDHIQDGVARVKRSDSVRDKQPSVVTNVDASISEAPRCTNGQTDGLRPADVSRSSGQTAAMESLKQLRISSSAAELVSNSVSQAYGTCRRVELLPSRSQREVDGRLCRGPMTPSSGVDARRPVRSAAAAVWRVPSFSYHQPPVHARRRLHLNRFRQRPNGQGFVGDDRYSPSSLSSVDGAGVEWSRSSAMCCAERLGLSVDGSVVGLCCCSVRSHCRGAGGGFLRRCHSDPCGRSGAVPSPPSSPHHHHQHHHPLAAPTAAALAPMSPASWLHCGWNSGQRRGAVSGDVWRRCASKQFPADCRTASLEQRWTTAAVMAPDRSCSYRRCRRPSAPSQYYRFNSSQPPQRPWIPLDRPCTTRSTCIFTVMCYNVLCEKYATRQMYGYCPKWALDWEYRKKFIMQEIRNYSADIITLQEVQTDQFYDFFLPELQRERYTGIFSPKSRAKTMAESERKFVDGCAIFWRTDKFTLVKEHLIEFNQLAMANAEGSDDMLNRVMTKDNIGLAAMLETHESAWENNGACVTDVAPSGGNVARQRLLVCTAHIHWDPEYCDVKLIQCMMLLHEIGQIMENASSTSSSSSATTSSSSADAVVSDSVAGGGAGGIQLLLCGDLNSLPDSGVVEFLVNGRVSADHRDFKELGYRSSLRRLSECVEKPCNISGGFGAAGGLNGCTAAVRCEYTHPFRLTSSYAPEVMPFTNFTHDFRGIIDYIFHSRDTMTPLGVLGPLDADWLRENKVHGCPHPHIPSDHFSLLVELEMCRSPPLNARAHAPLSSTTGSSSTLHR